jgi:ribonuclease Z
VKYRFEVIIIGCGAAAPNLRFMTTAQAVNIHEHWMLLDAGEGVQTGLRKHKVPFSKLNHIFISHMHGDHVLGLPGLIGSMNLLGRTADLHLHGPEVLEPWLMESLRMTETHLKFKLVFHVHVPGVSSCTHATSGFQVLAFPTRHRIPTHGFVIQELPRMGSIRPSMIEAHALNFEEIRRLKSGHSVREDGHLIRPEEVCMPGPAPRSYAFAADTRPSDDVVDAVRGVDLLYHEATFRSDLASRAKETGHSTAFQAAEVAARAGVKALVLGHFSARYKDLEGLRQESRKAFDAVELASDGLVLRL